MSPDEAAGTPYGGATAPLRAKTAVTPGAHTVFLSILDLNDNAYDTAVFVDALRTSNESAATCVPRLAGHRSGARDHRARPAASRRSTASRR